MRVFAVLCAVLGFGVAASAATLSYTYNKPLSSANWTQTFAVTQFDPALGTLNSVSITVDADLSQTLMFENFNGPGSITFSAGASTTGCAYVVKYTAGATLVSADIVNTPTYAFSAYDGVMDFGGTSGHTDVVVLSGVNSAMYVDGATLAAFSGLGTVSIDATATGRSAYSFTGGNGAVGVMTSAGADVTVVYDYEPIPEPATMALLVGGLALLRRR